jgi:hypothetical protein
MINKIFLSSVIIILGMNSISFQHKNVQKAPKLESRTTSIKSNGYILLVRSLVINDSVDSTSHYYSYPIFTEQTLFLYHNKKLILKRKHPVKKVQFITYHKQKVKALENRICEIGIYKGKSEMLFYIDGWGGCTDCSTYLELVDKKGKTVFLDYSDKFKVIKFKGNFNKELKKRSIDYNENINKIKLIKKI